MHLFLISLCVLEMIQKKPSNAMQYVDTPKYIQRLIEDFIKAGDIVK